MFSKTLYFLFLLLGIPSAAYSMELDKDKLVEVQRYACVDDSSGYERLLVPGNRQYLDIFQQKLSSVLATGEGRVNILHIGGSHVQGGSYSHQLRTDFANINEHAAGDRGMVFPFKAIRTNAPSNYSFDFTGNWKRSRCISSTPDAVLGLSGAAAISASADCSLTLDLKDSARWCFDALRLLGYASNDSIVPYIILDEQRIYADSSDTQTGYLFHLPHEVNGCQIAFENLTDSTSFTVRGCLPISHRTGITYSESGVNGAAVPSWLRCPAFEEELSLLPPDLVIFGIGINDANGANFDASVFKDNYRQLIARIRKVNPQAAFIFITNNDCFFKKKYNPNTPIAEKAFIDLAKEFDGAVFNVFRLMGGPRSSNAWVKAELMAPDHVHFKTAGYQLLGDLLFNAIITDNIEHQQTGEDSLVNQWEFEPTTSE